MADVWDAPPTDEEMAQAGPPPPPEPPPTVSPGEHPLPTSTPVLEPGGGVAPELSPDDTWASPPTDQELAKAQAPKPSVTPGALQFIAQHGDLPQGDKAAQVLRYSVASGLPPNLVAADFDNVKRRVDAQGVDWKALAQKQPALAAFLAETPHVIPLAQQDTHNLGVLEWAFGGHPFAAFLDAVHQQETVGLQFLRAEGVKGLEPSIQQHLDEDKQASERFGPDYGAHNALTKGLVATAKFAPYMLLDKAARVLGGTAGAFAAGLGGASAGAAAGAPAAGVGAVPVGAAGGVTGVVAGAATGQFVASGLFNYAEALGPLSWQLDHVRDANGQPIDPAVANAAAQAGAVASGALMSGTMGLWGTKKLQPVVQGWAQTAVPAVGRAIQGVAQSAVVKWLEDSAVRSTISRFLGRFGLHAATGAAMLAANNAVTQASVEAAKGASGMDAGWGPIGDAMYQGGKQGLQDLWLLSAVHPAVQAVTENLGRGRLSAESAVRFDKSVEAAKNSTLLAKSPETFEAFLNLAAPHAKVYVPADKWVSYFQGKKLDPAQVAQEVGVHPDTFSNTVTTGGLLEFGADKFITRLTKDGHAEGLSMDVKSSPELETAREFKARQDTEAKRLVEDAKKRGTELDEGKKAVESFILAQAKASKLTRPEMEGVKAGTKLMSEAVATQALNLNVSMQESARLMRLGDLSLTGKEGPTPAHEESAKAFQEWLAPSASQQLKAKFESMSPENQARAVFLDKNTGLPNLAHFEDLNDHEASQSFGEGAEDLKFANVGIAGTKFINDTLDHGKGDLLYRAAAKALHEAAPELNVSKPGGDFEFRVRDQAHLDEVLKKANANLPEQLKPFVLTGAVGESRDKAAEAHVDFKKAAEAAGTRAPRTDANGKAVPPLGFKGEAKDIVFPEEKVTREPHPEVAKQFSGLSKEEKFAKAFVEPKTGLLTSLGWQMLDHGDGYHYAALDVRDLKSTNEKFDKVGGDTLIETFGQIVSHYGGSSFDAAHLHGDEYALRHRDPYKLSQMVDRIREHLRDPLVAVLPDGERVRVGIGFWHGIARGSYEAADRNLSERKAEAKGAASSHVAPRAPGGDKAGVDKPERQGSLERVGGLLEGRGASPQGYPGADRSRLFNQEAVVPQSVLDAQDWIGRMRSPEKKAAAAAYLDYATGKTDQRPRDVPDEVISHMADEWGIVHPDDEPALAAKGLSKRGDYKGPKKSGGAGEMPDALRRYRLMNLEHRTGIPQKYNQTTVAHIEGKPVVFEQAKRTQSPVEIAVSEHEARIRGEENEHAAAVSATGETLFTHTSGHTDRVELTEEQGAALLSRSDVTFIHNHPRSGPLSADDVALAVAANFREIRAVHPNGDVLSLKRHEAGWGYATGSRRAQMEIHGELRAAEKAAMVFARSRMDKVIADAGGDPDQGAKAKGYSDEKWREIYAEEATKAFNEFAKSKGLKWRIERHAREDLGRAGDSESQHADVPSKKVTLEQGGENGPRGEIRLDVADTGRPRSLDIRMLGGDKSTFVHEAAHFLSWSLHDLASSDLATPQVRADYETLLKFAGYESAEARLEALKAGTNAPQEEKISHGFEAYLAEGKAPSKSLARVFSRFKDWLLRIYKGLPGVSAQYKERYGQELQLSDEVRGVFARLLAQEEAVRKAGESVGGTGPDAEALKGMTPEQADAYRKHLADAKADADTEAAQGGDERQEAMEAQREAFRQQTQAELDAHPVYKAWRYLQHGELPEGEPPTDNEGKPFKLDRAAFDERYGDGAAARMPPGSFDKGGVPADVLAPVLGFNSGDDMVSAMTSVTPRDEAIAQGTQGKMDAAFGPELERQTEAALSGVHSDEALKAAVEELRALAKQVNPALERQSRALNVEALRRNIDRMTGEKPVGELDPANYARTERKLALEAAELWGKGEKEAAYDKKEQRFVNKLLFMAERDAKKELESARDRLSNPSDAIRGDLGKADPAYRDVHDALLAAVGLAPARPEQTLGLAELVDAADRDGHELGPWVETVRQLLERPKAWDQLPVDTARDVADAVANIRHVADESLNVTLLGKKQALDDLRQAIANRTATVQPAVPRPAYGGKEAGLRERLAMRRRGLSAVLQDVETISEMMDGGTAGPVHDLLINSRLEARDREVALIQGVLEPLRESFKSIPKDVLRMRDQSVDVAHLLPPPAGRDAGYTRSFLWSLFLNLGNEGNLQRLKDGNKWDPEAMRAAVGLLSTPELDFLQRLRDTANSLYGPLSEAYEKRTGLKLGKVEALPIMVNGREYAGGYWPIRYDRSAEGNQGQRQEINDIKDLFPTRLSPTVTNSATKGRVQTVLAPLDLTWGTVPAHFATVIHDIAYGDWVRQVAKVLVKPRVPGPIPSFDKTATDYLGPERAKELLPWLRDVAAARADSNAGHVADAIRDTGWMRSRLTAAAIMLNMPSTTRHLFDPWTTMADSEAVLPHYISGAYLKVMNPANWGAIDAFKDSKELQYRHATHDDNLRTELNRMGKVTGLMQKGTEVGFALHKWVDMFTTRVAFVAAYDQALANGATREQAIQRGDDVVRRSFPSGDIAEKPPILRTRQGWAAAVTFYGYAAKMHNLRSRAFDTLYRGWNAEDAPELDPTAPPQGGKASAVAEVAAKMIGLGLVSAMGGYFAGRGPTQQEDDEKGKLKSRMEWLATETMLSPMDDAPPIVGPAIKATLLGHKTNIASVPELSLVDHQLGRLGQLMHGKKQDEENQSKGWGLAAALIGAMGPLGQANRTIPYLGDVSSGKQRPRGPFDFAAGAIYGDKKTRGVNPLTDLQDFISGGHSP